jgi:hypothetical protein
MQAEKIKTAFAKKWFKKSFNFSTKQTKNNINKLWN